MLYFSNLKKEDLHKYSRLVRPEVNSEDYYCHKTLLKEWNNIKSYVLMNEQREWIGWCAFSTEGTVCNPTGSKIIGSVIFPKFRNQGYCKYLYKIIFEKTIGKDKLIRINPFNDVMKKTSQKYGFAPHNTCDIWNTYFCKNKDCPKELKDLNLTEVNL